MEAHDHTHIFCFLSVKLWLLLLIYVLPVEEEESDWNGEAKNVGVKCEIKNSRRVQKLLVLTVNAEDNEQITRSNSSQYGFSNSLIP